MILAYTGSTLTWIDYSNGAIFHSHLWWCFLTQQCVQRCSCTCCGTLSDFALQCHLPIALAFGRGAEAKTSKGFPIQYRLLIALAFEKSAEAKLSKGVPLQCYLLIALAFERGTVTKLSGAFRSSVKRLPVYYYMYARYIQLLETEGKGNNNLQKDLVSIVSQLGTKF